MSTFSLFYCPPIRFFADWISQKGKVIDIHENYQKQTYRNRCHILSPNGVQKLIIPIEHNGTRVMKDLKISYAEDWQKEHFKSLEAAYRRSPYFEFYEDSLCPVFLEKKYKYLIDLNFNILEQLLILLQLNNDFSISESYVESEENDFRNAYNAKTKVNLPEYTQVFSEKMEFQSDLSILDLLFNEGPQSILYLKQL